MAWVDSGGEDALRQFPPRDGAARPVCQLNGIRLKLNEVEK
jgi:hypothetical protein